MSCTAPGRLATETTRLVQSWPDAFGCGCAVGWATIAKRVRLFGVVLDRRRDDDAGRIRSPRARWPARPSDGSRPASRAPSALLATGRRSAREGVAEPGVALGERLRMGADGADAVERVVLRSRLWRTSGWSRRRSISGVVRNRSSERVTTPSLEFSTGTTPNRRRPRSSRGTPRRCSRRARGRSTSRSSRARPVR